MQQEQALAFQSCLISSWPTSDAAAARHFSAACVSSWLTEAAVASAASAAPAASDFPQHSLLLLLAQLACLWLMMTTGPEVVKQRQVVKDQMPNRPARDSGTYHPLPSPAAYSSPTAGFPAPNLTVIAVPPPPDVAATAAAVVPRLPTPKAFVLRALVIETWRLLLPYPLELLQPPPMCRRAVLSLPLSRQLLVLTYQRHQEGQHQQ